MDSNNNKTNLINKTCKELRVYLTGYGPFMDVTDNPSQALVNAIIKEKSEIEKDIGISIVYNDILNVNTTHVDETIPKCYDIINDSITKENNVIHFITHFGVNSKETNIRLEKISKNCIKDSKDPERPIVTSQCTNLYCKLDLESMKDNLEKLGHNVVVSVDAGNYLCNYVYFKSNLNYDINDRVIPIFIHIPTIENINTEKLKLFYIDFLKVLKKEIISC